MFPSLYHAHHTLHLEDLPFWKELAARQGDPVLELGCGTGRVLLPLAQAGWKVWGLDNDAAMLAFLKRRLAGEKGLKVNLIQADLAAFHLDLQFSLILLPCNTLSTLPAPTRLAALECARHHLRPGGAFAASLPNPARLQRLPRHAAPDVEEIFPDPVDSEPVQVSSAWERNDQLFTVFWHYDHLLPDGRVERLTAEARHILSPVTAYLNELQETGLDRVEQYGDFDWSPYSPDSPNLILVAQKL